MYLNQLRIRGKTYWRLVETEYKADGTKRTKTLAHLGRDLKKPLTLINMWTAMGRPRIPYYNGLDHWLIFDLTNFFLGYAYTGLGRGTGDGLSDDQLRRIAEGLLILLANTGNWEKVYRKWPGRRTFWPDAVQIGDFRPLTEG